MKVLKSSMSQPDVRWEGLMKPPARQAVCRLSASLIGESKLYIFDTEGGKRLTQFCAISSSPSETVAKSECLNLYNLETHRSQAPNYAPQSRRPIPLSFGNWLPFRQLLTTINEYFRRSQKGSILIAHSAISSDSAHLTSGLLQHFQQRRRDQADGVAHGHIVGYIDTLPLFRWLYPNLGSYKQKDLVRYFLGVANYNAHNALDDSLMLFTLWRKYIWPATKDNIEILSQASVSNVYCVDRYLAKSSFSLQSYFEGLMHSKLLGPPKKPKRQIKLYHTKLLLNHLYPVLNKVL